MCYTILINEVLAETRDQVEAITGHEIDADFERSTNDHCLCPLDAIGHLKSHGFSVEENPDFFPDYIATKTK